MYYKNPKKKLDVGLKIELKIHESHTQTVRWTVTSRAPVGAKNSPCMQAAKLFVTNFTFTFRTVPNKTRAPLFWIVWMVAAPPSASVLPLAIRSSYGMQQSKLCNGDTNIRN